jgi:phosphoglycerol transferase MdoB-like AlkP superfamily enzyme
MRGRAVFLMSTATSFWKTLSRRSFFLFLLGVFFVFSAVGFASDVADMGRTPKLRFVLSILISGIFPVCYAFAGFALRKHFWKLFVPVFAVHFFLMNELSASLPSPRQAAQMDAADIARMHHRWLSTGTPSWWWWLLAMRVSAM